MDAVLLILGIVLLIGAGDSLVRGAVALSLSLGIPAIIVSATIIAFGTSAPELIISVDAALSDAPGIALGNVVGSNIANVLLVLGLPALIAPIAGAGRDTHRSLWLMLGATALFAALMQGGVIWAWGGAALMAAAVFMVWDAVRQARSARSGPDYALRDQITELERVSPHMARWKIALLTLGGLALLPVGAHLLVEGARGIARELGVSEAAIGLTVVALGTSLPELATTVMAALRGRQEVALGNVIGSNIFNLTAIVGAAALASPLAVPAAIAGRDLWVMIGASLLLTPYVLFGRRIGRIEGAAWLALYAGFVYYAVTA